VGLDAVLEPVIERHVLTDAAEEIGRLDPDDWLVLTSVYAIEHVAAGPARVPRVAVVGEITRNAAEACGFRVELVAPGESRESLWGVLRRTIKSGLICYPRSSFAPPPQAWPSVTILSPILYETAARAFDRGVIHRVDAISVASPSAVEAIGPLQLPFASIGPATSEALRRLGIEPWVEAPRRTFEALAEAIAAAPRRAK
jgi:uroporphyrinogen-III synthase